MSLKDRADEVAVVIDQHTGRVRAQFQGFGAKEDAERFSRTAAQTINGKKPIKELSVTAVVTGADAKKAIENGRI